MFPITLLAAQKVANLLNTDGAVEQQIASLAQVAGIVLPVIESANIVLSSVSPEIGDKDVQLTYPRICLYSTALKNTQVEKFRSLSGSIAVTADVWASSALLGDVNQWIHFYVEATTEILRRNRGDWGDGVYFGGGYEVQFQPAKIGGFGYVESARLSLLFTVSRN